MPNRTHSFVITKRDGTQHHVLVDEVDTERVSRFTWWLTPEGYVYTVCRNSNGGWNRKLYLHRFILGLTPGDPIVDHENGVKLDNRRINLRLSSKPMNVANQAIINWRGTSRYRGVHWRKDTQRWVAGQKVNYRRVTIGCFDTEEEAAAAVAKFRIARGLPDGY